jgi:uncharacterized membrane protein
MRKLLTRAALALALLLAASAANAQPNGVKPAVKQEGPGGVHRMEIFNGPTRTVEFIYSGLSPSEESSVREMQRAANEALLADDLLALRRQYVRNERSFESRRHAVQELLYGYSNEESNTFTASAGGWGGWGGYPFLSAYPYGSYPASFSSGFSGTTTNTLAYGVGDEGVIKTAMARTLAAQATPEYAAQANLALQNAVARGSQSDAIRTGLGMSKAEPVAAAGFETTMAGADVVVTRTLEGKNEKVEGKMVREDGNWLVIDTKDGRRTIPKSQVVDILEPKK